MDEELRKRIAASLDLPEDSPADPEVARALDVDPEAASYARGLYVLERALRRWPVRPRDEADWERAEAKLLARIESDPGRAKVKRGAEVSRDDLDATAAPVFHDGGAADHDTESMRTMSESQDNDADLEALAALTRTSLGPGAIPSSPPRAVGPSITDDVDETSSGIVDIKSLAAVARASVVPVAEEAKPAAEPEKVEEEPKAPALAKPAAADKPAPKTDVMVRPKALPATQVTEEAPPRRGGGFKGMLIGVAVSAAAFFLYTQTQSSSPSPTGAAAVSPDEGARTESAPAPAEAPAQAPAAAAPVVAEAPPPPAPEAAPTPAPPAAVGAPEAAAADPGAAGPPAPAAAIQQAGPPAPGAAGPRHAEGAQRHAATAPAPRAARTAAPTTATATAEAPRPPPAAPPAAPAAAPAPAPTAPARGGAGAAAAAAPAARPSGGNSVDDLMNQVAGAPARPAAAAAAAPAEELPERLSRSQVTSVLSGLAGAVRQCAGGQTGTAPFSLTIANDGTVQTANLSGQFSGTPQGECMEGVVRRARFGRFRNPTQSLVYPFVIQPPR